MENKDLQQALELIKEARVGLYDSIVVDNSVSALVIVTEQDPSGVLQFTGRYKLNDEEFNFNIAINRSVIGDKSFIKKQVATTIAKQITQYILDKSTF